MHSDRRPGAWRQVLGAVGAKGYRVKDVLLTISMSATIAASLQLGSEPNAQQLHRLAAAIEKTQA